MSWWLLLGLLSTSFFAYRAGYIDGKRRRWAKSKTLTEKLTGLDEPKPRRRRRIEGEGGRRK